MGKQRRQIRGTVNYRTEEEREEIAERARGAGLSVSNYLRALAGLGVMRTRGGIRENAGWNWCDECLRAEKKRRVWLSARVSGRVSRLCQECWQRAADGEEMGK